MTAGRYAIYRLVCPYTGNVRYIGQTRNPESRLETHCRPGFRDKTPKANWIRKLLAGGARPIMEVIEWVSDWDEAERRHIAEHAANGIKLLNANEGGKANNHLRKFARTRKITAVGYIIKRLSGFQRDCARNGDAVRAEVFRKIADGIRSRRREKLKSGGDIAVEMYEAFVAGLIKENFGAHQ
jgi:hypothetical protein